MCKKMTLDYNYIYITKDNKQGFLSKKIYYKNQAIDDILSEYDEQSGLS